VTTTSTFDATQWGGNVPTAAEVADTTFGVKIATSDWPANVQSPYLHLCVVAIYYTVPDPIQKDVTTTVSVIAPSITKDVLTSVAVTKVESTDISTSLSVVPGVGITEPDPGDTITDAAFTVTWETKPGGQTSYRVVISTDSSGTPVIYDTGVIAGADMQHSVSAGVLPSPESLYIKVYVTVGALSGASDWVAFDTNFAAAQNVTGVTVREFDCRIDPTGLPYVLVRWTKVVVTGLENFIQYDIRRRVSGSGDEFIRIGVVEDEDTLEYKDYTAAPWVTYDYTVVYEATTGSSTLISVNQSPPQFAMLQFDHVYLHEPSSATFLLLYTDDVSVDVRDEVVFNQPWGQSSPNAYFGEVNTHEINIRLDSQVLTDQRIWTQLAELRRLQREEGATLCLRLGRGRERYFVTLLGPSKKQSRYEYETDLRLQETYYVEAL
jgi:hypothetical protein